MKCIYCNREEELTVSDIIPWALTGAKVKRRFVCKEHNEFTNNNYEKTMISRLDIFRNRIGLKERDGDPVRFNADLNINGYIFKNVSISDKSSIMGISKRKFSRIDEDGRKIIVGDKKSLLDIPGVSEEKIETLDMTDISISSKADLRELFISNETLHTVAKIAYEWHCYINGIECFKQEKYNSIVSYILTPESKSTPVEIVTDEYIWTVMDYYSRTGTNMIFEYQECDGYTYVIFGFWGVILYKIRVCGEVNVKSDITNTYQVNLYHVDGSEEHKMFAAIGGTHIHSEPAKVGLLQLCDEVKNRLSKLGERDLTREYLKVNIDKIKKMLPQYKNGKCTLAKLLDFEHDDRVFPIYIIELLSINKQMYNMSENFNKNMLKILNCGERFVMTEEKKKEILRRYVDMDAEGTFFAMLESAIDFFETTCMKTST